MNITIINGVHDATFAKHERTIAKAIAHYSRKNHIDYFIIRKLNVSTCIGCFGCWVKTPGVCIIKDDMEAIVKSMAKTDFVLYISPLITGFITTQLKMVLDRSIPILLPIIKIYNGECHHPKRYDNPFNIGIVLLHHGHIVDEEASITFDIFDRTARNMHAEKVLKRTATSKDLEGIINEINGD